MADQDTQAGGDFRAEGTLTVQKILGAEKVVTYVVPEDVKVSPEDIADVANVLTRVHFPELNVTYNVVSWDGTQFTLRKI